MKSTVDEVLHFLILASGIILLLFRIIHADMKQFNYTFKIVVFYFMLTLPLYGQVSKAERQFIQYIKSMKVDSMVVFKSGCLGCSIQYADTAKNVLDGKTIYVLTKKHGQMKLVIFDDIHNPKYFTLDSCSLFGAIHQPILKHKNKFYKKELAILKTVKFLAPKPTHYTFEELTIQLPNFKYNFLVIDRDSDYMGFIRKNEDWFVATRAIIEQFLVCIQSTEKVD